MFQLTDKFHRKNPQKLVYNK